MAKNVSVLGRKIRRFSTVQSVLTLGLVGISGSGCSDFLASNCRETRSCPQDHDAAAGGADAGAAVSDHGGSAATGGSAGAGGAAAGGISGEGSGGEGSGGKPEDKTDGAAGEPPVDAGADSGGDASPGRGSDAGGDSGPLICAKGLADCNLDSRDGCEAVLASNAAHCGACNHACSSNGATAQCDSGVCKPACLPGHADCNKNPDDGCEVDLTKDTSSCGACGHACGTENTQAASPVSCDAGICKPNCAKGYGDCKTPANTATDDGCETDLNSNTTCGACSHDCLGGECKAQMCVPLQLTSALDSANGLAADRNGVYWTDRTGGTARVMRTSLTGTGETLVASDDVGTIGDNPLVSNGSYIVWPTTNTAGNPSNGKLRRLASGSSDILDIATGVDVSALTMDATNVYYTGSDNQTHQVALDRSGTTVLGSVTGAAMVVDAKGLYFVGGVNLRSLTLASRQSYEVTPSPNIFSTRLAQDAQNLYMWSYSSSSAEINLMRMAKTFQGSATPVTLATRGAAYAPIVVDGTYVYFGQADGVYRVPTTGGTPQPLASATYYPRQIVLNGGAIYWIDQDASSGTSVIKKLAVFSK